MEPDDLAMAPIAGAGLNVSSAIVLRARIRVALDQPGWWRDEEIAQQIQDTVMRAAAWYFVRARNARGTVNGLPMNP